MPTEMETLKKKCFDSKGQPKKGASQADLARYKQLKDGEPLSKADLAAAEKREADQLVADKAAYEVRQKAKPQASGGQTLGSGVDGSLDPPTEHPRITALKAALAPFTQIEAHVSRPNEFVLFTRGISITAGDVRRAQKAMRT